MIKKLLSICFIIISYSAFAQTTISSSFIHGGLNRTYSYYVPASYTPGQPVPLVLNLHGYTSNGLQQSFYGDFKPIADTANFIVVHPDGTDDPFTFQPFWNYGIFGATVDDVSFLEALIDTISADYSINQNRIYSVGMSNGGFMSYCMACETDRFAAVGSVTGSMSVGMYNSCNPAHPTPTISIHGVDDSVCPYNGTSTSKSIPDVTQFWVNQNGCNSTPSVTAIPDINSGDGATAERFLYTGGTNGNTIEHFKITGGGHTWPGAPILLPSSGNTCLDFSASIEVWRFFSQYEKSATSSVSEYDNVVVTIYPNPSSDFIYIQSENHELTNVSIYDLQGRLVLQKELLNQNSISINELKQGNYLIEIIGKNFKTVKKLVVLSKS